MNAIGKYLVIALFGVLFNASPQVVSAEENQAVKSALLIIDVQQFYFPGGSLPLEGPEQASANIKKLLKAFRQRGDLVVHVGHNAKKGREFHPSVRPRKDEKVIFKDEVSAFNGTDLLDYLKNKGVNRLVITGMQTHMCVEAAVRAAHDLGFECVLVHDACATRDLTFQDEKISARNVHLSTLSTLNNVYATVIDTNSFLKDLMSTQKD